MTDEPGLLQTLSKTDFFLIGMAVGMLATCVCLTLLCLLV